MAAIAQAFKASPREARPITRAYTWLTDCLVSAVHFVAAQHLHPLANPTRAEHIALLAVGGYGRKELAPFSDVDLLMLTPWKISSWVESVIESMLYILWDLRLKIGYSTRSIDDCLRLGRTDSTIRTSLLEHRFLCGDAALAADLRGQLWQSLFCGSGQEFIATKLAEREARHIKQGARYVVEPNVKEGKGGLRDLHSLFWIAKYVYRVSNARELADIGLFRAQELARFERAENFLWATRAHLHLIEGRAVDHLTFNRQVGVAEAMGYKPRGRRAVEHFMQDYFRHATAVGDLTRIFLTKLEADHGGIAPLRTQPARRPARKLRPGYKVVDNRITVADETRFLADGVNLLRLFEESLRTGLSLHPDATRLASAHLHLIDYPMRKSPAAQRIFLDLLLKHGNPERALRLMNESGVLAAFLPEFAPIVAAMPFDMYHAYTVDEHTIQVIANLTRIERLELEEQLPLSTDILKKGVNKRILIVAMLLHDIGKGQDMDHSIVGAQIARRVAPRLGLNPTESQVVEWLVRHHLLMSDTAQKRDIADPRTVRGFAKAVKTVERLDLLTVLTVCDIRAVAPSTWNNWKAVLLRALYRQARQVLEQGMEALNRENRGTKARALLRRALTDWSSKALERETQRHYDPYWQGLHVSAHVVFARMLQDITAREIRIDLHPDKDRDATRVCFVAADHPGVFSRMCGALALVGANVVDARTFTSRDGYATAVFWIQNAEAQPYAASRFERLSRMIQNTMEGKVITAEALRQRDKINKRTRAFAVPTTITFDNEGSDIYTIIEVDTRDRPGLLFDLASTLAKAHVNIASAVIATYGAQVVDTFYVKDAFGLKYYSAARRRTLERQLRDAIRKGGEGAQQ